MKKKAPRLVIVATITTITLVFWIFYGLYNIIKTTPAPVVPEELVKPISPNLDTKTLDSISDRVYFEEGERPLNLIPTPTVEVEIEIVPETASPTASVVTPTE